VQPTRAPFSRDAKFQTPVTHKFPSEREREHKEVISFPFLPPLLRYFPFYFFQTLSLHCLLFDRFFSEFCLSLQSVILQSRVMLATPMNLCPMDFF